MMLHDQDRTTTFQYYTRTGMRLASKLKHRIVCLDSFLPAGNLSHPRRKRIAAPVQVRVTTLCNMILQE